MPPPVDAEPPLPEGWWDGDWRTRYRVDLSFEGLDERAEGVPAVLWLKPDAVDLSLAGEGGRALRLVDSGGALLPIDIESWSPDDGARVWFRLDVVSPDAVDPHVWLYVDNPTAPSVGAATAVWDDDFSAVYHFSGGVLDATSNGLDGSRDESGVAGEERHTGGRSWEREDAFLVADDPELDLQSVTISAWVRPSTRSHHHGVLSKRVGCGGRANYALFLASGRQVQFEFFNDRWRTWRTGDLRMNDWAHVSATFRAREGGGEVRIYINGQERLAADSSIGLLADDNPVEIAGNGGCGGDYFEGDLDEVRVSRIARGPSWIRAAYHTMTSQLVRAIRDVETL